MSEGSIMEGMSEGSIIDMEGMSEGSIMEGMGEGSIMMSG